MFGRKVSDDGFVLLFLEMLVTLEREEEEESMGSFSVK